MDDIVISATVVTTNPEHVTRSIEAFARCAAGLGLDGLDVNLNIGTVTDDDVSDDET